MTTTQSPISGALTPESKGGGSTTVSLNLDDVFVDKEENSRHKYDEEGLKRLAEQIKSAGGLMQDPGVLKIQPEEEYNNKEWILVFGYRRWLALQMLAEEDESWAKDIQCKVTKVAGKTGLKIVQIAENIQREDLNPIEIAGAIQEAIELSDGSLNQAKVAEAIGLKPSRVSQYMGLLNLPDSAKSMIEDGTFSFSHARAMLGSSAPVTEYADLARTGAGQTFGDFKKMLDRNYSESEEGAETEDDGTSSQKTQAILRSTELKGSYLPFLKGKVKGADKSEKKYSEFDLEKARLDTIQTVLREPDTTLAEDIQPFLENQKKEEEAADKAKKSDKAHDDFLLDKVREMEGWLKDYDPETGERRRGIKDITDAVALVVKQVKGLKKAEIEKLGFELDLDTLAEDLITRRTAYLDKKKADAQKRAEKKEQKEKEEAAKKAAEETASSK